MKERFTLMRRVYPEHRGMPEGHIVLGRWYRLAGRLCLLGSVLSSVVEILIAGQGNLLSPMSYTHCSVYRRT